VKILFIADVVGDTGRRILAQALKPVREELGIDFCIANGENMAGGKGLTQNTFAKLTRFGVDAVTTGNHIWDNPDILPALQSQENLLRPLNYPEGNAGKGSAVFSLANGVEVAVINLQGRVFMPAIDCPFSAGLREVERLRSRTPVIVVDFHAEATSEKVAMGWYLDGKVSAVVGTHTHVQSADERVLPKGTAYITDAGMTGARDSVIGVKKELIIRRLLLQSYVRFEPASEDPILNAVVVDIDAETGKARSIERIFRPVTLAFP
jgi:hypothetical protein